MVFAGRLEIVMIGEYLCETPQDTFDLGEKLGASLSGGEMILLSGGLGAGKTLFTKGVLYALGFDVDEVTSPSFTLVNLYKTEKFDVFHIDLWRIDERSDAASAVGLGEILEDEKAVTIIEWSERLKDFPFPEKTFRITIDGDGDDARTIKISRQAAKAQR
ncbi:MAG TPA: tRNA (adenosine(37)-N6)-threonylcarbamoyltransferase complex ATPase subunit type 1 TsaE [Pyrinomonadaceae bacterium]|nr:tRNA (adenosine(37)-N6)-threonylcarbamoyltransferase complex ATPase subunit type 1 TsaE [Pyrinomonadaceae bacterium]